MSHLADHRYELHPPFWYELNESVAHIRSSDCVLGPSCGLASAGAIRAIIEFDQASVETRVDCDRSPKVFFDKIYAGQSLIFFQQIARNRSNRR
jgi:hypothetical protein